jgi:NADP-dependent 3-hydroxy acid dehydrogenase YdfG
MADPLSGKVVFVAGASSGMGRAIAVAAAGAGATLILLGRNSQGLEATLARVAQVAPAASALAVSADAADADALSAATTEIDLEAVDVLVNSVGTNIVERAFDQLTASSWAGMVDSNLTAAFNLCKLVVPAMRRRRRGLIVNIVSTAARKPDRSGAAYQASKAGVLALTHAIMEEEWQNGIRATAILPGMTDTPLLDKRPEPVRAEVRATALQPEDIAEACLFVMRLPERAHVSEIQMQPSRR